MEKNAVTIRLENEFKLFGGQLVIWFNLISMRIISSLIVVYILYYYNMAYKSTPHFKFGARIMFQFVKNIESFIF